MSKISKKEMVTFAAGDLFGGGAQLIIGFFYLRFLTDVIRINPILAGTVILISKIWDALSDPLMGVITDNTRTKFGRRKPYLLAGFFLIIISFTLLWYGPNFQSESLRFSFVVFSYLFFSTVSTIVMVPYTAFSSEITTDVIKRGRVNSMRLFFSQLSSLIGATLPMVIVNLFDDKLGYTVMGFVFAVFFAIPFLLIFLFCEERVDIPKEKSTFEFKKILSPFKIKTYRSLIIIYLLAFFVMDVVSAIFTYYMTYFIGREDLLELVLGTMLLSQIAALPLVAILSEKIGKPKTYILGSVIFIMGSFALGFYNVNWHISSVFIISAFVGLGLIGCIVMPWVMFPDVTDISQLAFGERRSGAFAGFMTFSRKFSSAIGIWVVGFMLAATGYIIPGEAIIPKDSTADINANSMVELDLLKDGKIDFVIDLNNESVDVINNNYSYDFVDGNFHLYDKTGQVAVIEKGLEVTKTYSYPSTSTIKSIKSFNQPTSFLTGVRVIVFVLPGILLLIAIMAAMKYPLTKERHEKLLQYYDLKYSGSDKSNLKNMKNELAKELI